MKNTATELIRNDCREVLTNDMVTKLSPLRSSRVVVTGGTGFVGSWLLEMISLLNEDHNFQTRVHIIAHEVDAFKKRHPQLVARPEITFVKNDVRHLLELPRDTNWLVHAAAIRDRQFHSTWPIETLATIATGTEQVLRASLQCSELKMFMNLSSGLVYGSQPDDVPRVPENFSGAPPLNNVNAIYAQAKRYGENLCTAYRAQERLPTMSVRPFSFIGPFQDLDSPWAVTNFIRDAINGKDVRVLGDGKALRSYMYPSDMALWMLVMMVSSEPGACYNVGSPDEINLADLAKKIVDYTSPSSRVLLSMGDSLNSKFSRLVPDVNLAIEKLKLKQTVTLNQAIAKTIEWHRA